MPHQAEQGRVRCPDRTSVKVTSGARSPARITPRLLPPVGSLLARQGAPAGSAREAATTCRTFAAGPTDCEGCGKDELSRAASGVHAFGANKMCGRFGLSRVGLLPRAVVVPRRMSRGVLSEPHAHTCQLPREIRRVLHAGRDALTAGRAVDVRRIAGQEHAAVVDAIHHAAVDAELREPRRVRRRSWRRCRGARRWTSAHGSARA